MSWTKGNLVDEAFAELALAGYIFDLQSDERMTALRRLDSMMALWNSQGIRLGYPLPSTPSGSSLDADSKLPDEANEAVFMNLAVRLAAGFGKQIPRSTAALAKQAYDALLSKSMSNIPEMQFPSTLPRGAGNKPWRNTNNPFMPTPEDRLTTGQDGLLEF